ncbi:MAG TPA: hypothetical protein VMF30_00955, partial [Pirellulales bacterium]|nr:hypothetical protein [Pirellulales bacterium]
MSWTNVKLILGREIRDQLRDRRTLFMIAVLPILLYPLLGMSFFQVAQFLREQPTRVLVIDLPAAEGLPPLVEKNHFATDLFPNKPERAKLLDVDVCRRPAEGEVAQKAAGDVAPCGTTPEDIRFALDERRYDAVLVFPPDFAQRLADFRSALGGASPAGPATADKSEPPASDAPAGE